jgi:hypothetical protein
MSRPSKIPFIGDYTENVVYSTRLPEQDQKGFGRFLAVHPAYELGCAKQLMSHQWEEEKDGFPPQFWFSMIDTRVGPRLSVPESHLTGETYCHELRSFDLVYNPKYVKNIRQVGIWKRNPKSTVNKAPPLGDEFFCRKRRCQAMLPCGKLCGRKITKNCGPKAKKCKIAWKYHNKGYLPRSKGRMLPQGVTTEKMKRRSRDNLVAGRAAKRLKSMRRRR